MAWPVARVTGAGWLTLPVEVTRPAGMWESGQPLELPRASSFVARVVTEEGNACAGIDVLAYRRTGDDSFEPVGRTRLGPDGEVELFQDTALPPGRYELRLHDQTVIWRGSIRALEERAITITLFGHRPVRITLRDQDGRAVAAGNVSVALLERSARVADSPTEFVPFGTAGGVVLPLPTGRSDDVLARVRFDAYGDVDVPVAEGADEISVSIPAALGGARFSFEGFVPASCTIELAAEDGGRDVRFYARLQEGTDSVEFHGVPPGFYRWRTISTAMPEPRTGRALRVDASRTVEVTVR